MRIPAITFVAGILFGLGLCLSEMVNPARVKGFLDVAGAWDPALLWVMLGAVAVATVGFRLAGRWPNPLFGGDFPPPPRQDADRRLYVGATLFGIGWGLVGVCPGPGLTALVSGRWDVVQVVVAMIIGMVLFEKVAEVFERR